MMRQLRWSKIDKESRDDDHQAEMLQAQQRRIEATEHRSRAALELLIKERWAE